ncbi:hypothetical protein SAMN05443633_106195 [Chryseobacterium arachidis]|uniref:DKNYY family protein n=1 Tax=Chryseobacterium arachidis TaxID=1416778 RepID=A0A1M5EFF5_9FLAO|nr:hypothetical protein [Chryseobacterium arachidis]SHF77802.1 hypothetical protein SAMN05443633_106195 [Chryseobacterium arachidis]
MKSQFLLFLFLSILGFVNAQTITFLSEKTNKPLPKVSVFGKDGSILAYSDIDGKIEKQALKPDQEKFQVVYNNYPVATLSYSDLNQDVIKIIDNVRDIETVVIKNTKPAKYIFVKGNFNSYLTVNNTVNCYADGIVTYIFDNSTKKLKSTNVEQYRIFKIEEPQNDRKRTFTLSYDSSLQLPDIKDAGTILDYKQKKNTRIKELKSDKKDMMEISGEALQKKEFAFLGYRFFDLKSTINISYDKDSKKTLRDFLEFNEVAYLKVKHKSEPEYNQLINYNNFYPTELSFKNEKDLEKVKFDTDNSNYSTNYWQDSSFPNMQTVFSTFFQNRLKEQQNKK